MCGTPVIALTATSCSYDNQGELASFNLRDIALASRPGSGRKERGSVMQLSAQFN